MRITNIADFESMMTSLSTKEGMEPLQENIRVAREIVSRLLAKQDDLNKNGFKVSIQGEVDSSLEPESYRVATGFQLFGNHGRWIETGTREAKRSVKFGTVKIGITCQEHFFGLHEQGVIQMVTPT